MNESFPTSASAFQDEGGRPSKYRFEYAEQARKLCLLGATDRELASFFGVCEMTINNWKKEHQEFCDSLRRGKMQADSNVAESLYRRALGYSHPEEKIFQYEGQPVRVDTTKHYPPDTAAASLWLRNRQPSKWKDNKNLALTGEKEDKIDEIIVTVVPHPKHPNSCNDL